MLFYHSSLQDYFYSDDFAFLERSRIRSLLDVINLFSVELNKRGLHDVNHSYRPLSTNLYFGLLQLPFGPKPLLFHLSNFAFLGLNAFLVYRLLSVLGVGRVASAAFAWLYSIASVNFTSQLWLSVCQELLFTFFLLLSFISYARWAANRRTGFYVLSLVSYAASVLSKEMAVALPVLLALYVVIVQRNAKRLASVLPFVVLTCAYLVARSFFFAYPSEGPYALGVGGFVLSNLEQYVRWSVEAAFLGTGLLLVGLALALALCVVLAADAGQRRVCWFGALWFVAALTPVLFMPNHIYRYYLTTPFVGLVIFLAVTSEVVVRRMGSRAGSALLAVALVSLFGMASYRRFAAEAVQWRDTSRSYESIVGQLKAQHPVLADHTELYFVFPPEFPAEGFLRNDGAALRVIYDNATLAAKGIDRRGAEDLRRAGSRRALVFEWTSNGQLLEIR